VKIVMHGPIAGYGPHGAIESWGPDTPVDIDDRDKTAVAWAKAWLNMGATLVEDVAEKPAKATPHKAAASG